LTLDSLQLCYVLRSQAQCLVVNSTSPSHIQLQVPESNSQTPLVWQRAVIVLLPAEQTRGEEVQLLPRSVSPQSSRNCKLSKVTPLASGTLVGASPQ
jgi:hypothetical protein